MRIPLQASASLSFQHQQARAYRTLLMAFAYPARLQQLEVDAMQACIDCLLDTATRVALSVGSHAWCERILATGAMLSSQPEWVFAGPELADLDSIPTGSREVPEEGATVVIGVEALSETALHTPGELCIGARGAGLKEPTLLFVSGLKRGVIEHHQAWHGEYPCGVDLLLCAGRQVVALPRHLTLELR